MAGDKQSSRSLNQSAEPLYGIQLIQDKVVIKVKSNGCTDAAHFDVQVSAEEGQHALLFVRNKADRCRKMPRIIRLELALSASSKTTKPVYRLVNPLLSS